MVTYTGSATYWAPLKPRIRIYALSDTTYSSALYTYNPFSDSGTDSKPISLRFESLTSNAGTFSIEIEDKDGLLDLENLTKGSRVFIDCSKDGSTFQPAFKGLVRSYGQNLYATTGRNITINGYSYLIRLNERILSTLKESALVGGEGTDYDRTDSTMFTNNLVNNLLTVNTNYINMVNDTSAYSIFKTADITGSSITEWVPRVDVSLDTLGSALDSVLEFSNGLVMVDFSTDQLELYAPDRPSAATGFFLLTDQIDQNADDADITMYPLEPYKYEISYDYPDSGSRLIGSIGDVGGCPETTIPGPTNSLERPWTGALWFFQPIWNPDRTYIDMAMMFEATSTSPISVSVGMTGNGNVSSGFTLQGRFYAGVQATNPISNYMPLYYHGDSTKTFPTGPDPNSSYSTFWIGTEPSQTGFPSLTPNTDYFFVIHRTGTAVPSANLDMGWVFENTGSGTYQVMYDNGGAIWGSATGTLRMDFEDQASGTTIPPCGGLPATKEADPVFAIAHDRNMSNRIGVVERALTDIPIYVKTAQVMHEYLFNKLYVAAKPRFSFDFPSVSMPNKIPKAGDMVAHVNQRANVGTKIGPIQTGVIDHVTYDFAQDSDGVLGLRKFGLSTTGIRKGYY